MKCAWVDAFQTFDWEKALPNPDAVMKEVGGLLALTNWVISWSFHERDYLRDVRGTSDTVIVPNMVFQNTSDVIFLDFFLKGKGREIILAW